MDDFTSVVKSAIKEDYCLLGCDALYSFVSIFMIGLHLRGGENRQCPRQGRTRKGADVN
jgi:hypothetical protein